MDKLQWFKFTYADWRMGKIQRCPEITQARFINLCCLYWSKECHLSYEDAEIEIDQMHLDILISKKIIANINNVISISFLDEQFAEIEKSNKKNSKSGIIGNLKRWHIDIYKKYEDKKITLEEALALSKEVSPPDSNAIASLSGSDRKTSQIRGEKIREEEIKEDKIKVDWDSLLKIFNNITKKSSRVISAKTRKQILSRLKEGYSKEDLIDAITNCYNDEFHSKNNHKYLTLEFISRPDKLESWVSASKRELTDYEKQQQTLAEMKLVKSKNIAG